MPEKLHRGEREPYVTRDGSTILELVHPDFSEVANQSLAEAAVAPGAETAEHLHRSSEEIYCFTAGKGRMRVGEAEFRVAAGDSVVIAPGTAHKLWNDGPDELRLLCCCSPPYSHEDTVLVE